LPADIPLARLADRVRDGEPRALARAITLIENGAPQGDELIRQLYAATGRARLIGVTGPPGAGKSTLVDRLTSEFRQAGQSIGVIAVDPTSPFTGGAVLGDRVRMVGQAADPGVFIRSMATRGHLGGIAAATADAALVLDAAGKETIIIETVGVGQGEIDIARTADLTILTLVPGTGDDVQALKAGIMEIADIFVINKADREGADRLVQAVTASLSLKEMEAGAWRPPVLKTVATEGVGVPELRTAIADFWAHTANSTPVRRWHRDEHRLRELLSRRLLQEARARVPDEEWRRLVDAITERRLDPYAAVTTIVQHTLPERSSTDRS
jgi:LAO/AO transport system kinase